MSCREPTMVGRSLPAVGIILLPRSDAIPGTKELDLGPGPEGLKVTLNPDPVLYNSL